jgi:uncharacterized protein (TIGR03067 family)
VLGFFGPSVNGQSKIDFTDLEGSWAVVSIIDNGKLVAPEKVKGYKFAFHKNKLTWFDPKGKILEEFRITLDTKQVPKAIDLVKIDDGKDGSSIPGIFEISQESLLMCLPVRGSSDRPMSLKSEKGSRASLLVLKKIQN